MQNDLAAQFDPDRDAVRRIAFCLSTAEHQLGLGLGQELPLAERCDRILRAALTGGLDPTFYKIGFLLRRACSPAPASEATP